MSINKGIALVSVADVLFFNPVKGDDGNYAYMGEGLALTESTITQEMQNIETRGGYLNALLFNIKHSKTVNVKMTSATFKLEYLAFQTGTSIVNGLSSVYKFDECVSFTNGVGSVLSTPLSKVYVRMPNGIVTGFTPTGSSVNIGLPSYNGQLQVMYQYNKTVEQLTIDTKTQPMTLRVVLRVHTLTQDGEEGYLEITVPRLKFNGAIDLTLSADTVSAQKLEGTALETSDDCGSAYYADAKSYQEKDTIIPVVGLVAVPNSYTLSLAGVKTATANIIGLRNSPYENIALANSEITFVSASDSIATVSSAGLITGIAAGTTQITATYQGMTETISITVQA